MWHVYIIKCSNNSFYVGLTNNLEHRLMEHQTGTGAQYTSARLPATLEYSESFMCRKDAERREKQLKSWSRAKKEALINGNSIKLQELSRRKS
jgi:predicted GIY-YIG superfamily endonuclease